MFKHAIAFAGLMAVALSTGQALAASTSATFQVKLTVTAACSVTAGATSDISLGSVASTATNVAGSNSIKVTCTKSTPYSIGLRPSNGNSAGAGVMLRAGGTAGVAADEVAYNLYSNLAHTAVWGNDVTAGTGNVVLGTGSGAEASHTVYAVAPSANSAAGTYADTVTVTINY